VQAEGSDLHLKVGAPPTVRVHGELKYLEGYEVLRPMATDDILKDIIPEKLVEEFEEDGEADFSYAVAGWADSGSTPSGSGGLSLSRCVSSLSGCRGSRISGCRRS
jgi:hypothetical protein